VQWLFAALNSVEIPSLRWSLFMFSGANGDSAAWKLLDDFLKLRLDRLEPVLAGREWLAGSFSVADIAMADALRLVDRFDRLAGHRACRRYVERATARPAFAKAHADSWRTSRPRTERAAAAFAFALTQPARRASMSAWPWRLPRSAWSPPRLRSRAARGQSSLALNPRRRRSGACGSVRSTCAVTAWRPPLGFAILTVRLRCW
jgi:hypothetical protein